MTNRTSPLVFERATRPTWRVLEDEGVELVVEVKLSVEAASLASLADDALLGLHDERGLGVVALRAQHELADEPVQQVLQFGRVVRAVHDEAVTLHVEARQRTQLTPKVLRWI